MEPAECAAGGVSAAGAAEGLRGLRDRDSALANISDRGLVAEILRDPWLVGWTCYLWNVERSLKSRLVKATVDARARRWTEITADNDWVLERPEVDFAAIGEENRRLLSCSRSWQSDVPRSRSRALCFAGAWRAPRRARAGRGGALPSSAAAMRPEQISSPYLCRP
jgi:hypothetical protein